MDLHRDKRAPTEGPFSGEESGFRTPFVPKQANLYVFT